MKQIKITEPQKEFINRLERGERIVEVGYNNLYWFSGDVKELQDLHRNHGKNYAKKALEIANFRIYRNLVSLFDNSTISLNIDNYIYRMNEVHTSVVEEIASIDKN